MWIPLTVSDKVRSKAKYDRTLELLRRAKEMRPDIRTKSSIMVGLGETFEEILETMDDLRAVGVDILTIGQYLQPTKKHLLVEKFYTPTEFLRLRGEGLKRGFAHVESGPMVRSSSMHMNKCNARTVYLCSRSVLKSEHCTWPSMVANRT